MTEQQEQARFDARMARIRTHGPLSRREAELRCRRRYAEQLAAFPLTAGITESQYVRANVSRVQRGRMFADYATEGTAL